MPAVIVVDDDSDTVDALAAFLGLHGWKVVPARTVSQALSLLRARTVAAIVSDYLMPDGDGAAVLAQAAKIQPKAKRILFTGGGTYPEGDFVAVTKPDSAALLAALQG